MTTDLARRPPANLPTERQPPKPSRLHQHATAASAGTLIAASAWYGAVGITDAQHGTAATVALLASILVFLGVRGAGYMAEQRGPR